MATADMGSTPATPTVLPIPTAPPASLSLPSLPPPAPAVTAAAAAGRKDDQLVVAVRVRPMNAREMEATKDMARPSVIKMSGSQTDLLGDVASKVERHRLDHSVKEDRGFTFDYSMWSANRADEHYVDQTAVYGMLGQGLLDNAFAGYNACIFAYGQTGSGKVRGWTGWGA